ncbi:hypothetical protein MYX75_02255 [Acidobacteria bacterium AH-259-A15]|nr:hypothetical protein [Acidobacteria bacterium AH-259-A15]
MVGKRATSEEMPKNLEKANGKTTPVAETDGGLKTSEPRGEALEGPILRMQIDLFNLGRTRAIESGALEPLARDAQSLEEHARAMARETYRESFDPTRYEHDRLRDHEYKKLLRDREEAESAVKFSAATVREREEELAKLQSGLVQPEASQFLLWAVLIVIAITVAPTLHDFVFSTIEDDLTAWFLSLVSGAFLGALISWGILGSFSATGRRTAASCGGLVAGLTITVGLGVFRVSGTQNADEVVLALALTIVETGVVVLAEWVAGGLRESYREWAIRQAAIHEATAHLEAARAQHKRCLELLEEIQNGIARHIAYVEDRELRHLSIKELEAEAVKAIVDGYHDGLAGNRGHVIGTRREQ